MSDSRRERFHALHESGLFVMPNPWDIGSAVLLAGQGFAALATTSAGQAFSLGRRDQMVAGDELLAHAAAIAGAVDVPVSIDAERCFAPTASGVTSFVDQIAATGAAGCSIEDYDPGTNTIDDVALAAERVAAAAASTARHGLVLTARAENHLYGVADLDDTITRLQAYRAAGADVVYAPGLVALADIARTVTEVPAPVSVLSLPDGPSVADQVSVGVRRVSTGGRLAKAAYGAILLAAEALTATGRSTYARSEIEAFDGTRGGT